MERTPSPRRGTSLFVCFRGRMTELLFANPDMCVQKCYEMFIISFQIASDAPSKGLVPNWLENERVVASVMGFFVRRGNSTVPVGKPKSPPIIGIAP